MKLPPVNIMLGVDLMRDCLVIVAPMFNVYRWNSYSPTQSDSGASRNVAYHPSNGAQTLSGHHPPAPHSDGEYEPRPGELETLRQLHDDLGKAQAAPSHRMDWSGTPSTHIMYAGTPRFVRSNWEPALFARLPTVTQVYSSAKRTSYIAVHDDEVARQQIKGILAGKFRWASAKDTSQFTRENYRKASPFTRTSRMLPLHHVDSPENIRFFMTDHVAHRQALPMAHQLYGKNFWQLWGVADNPHADSGRIYNYGAGYIDEADYNAVNRQLQQFLDAYNSIHISA